MSLTYFTVTGNYLSVAGQEVWDVSASPQQHPMSGTVTFTPIFKKGDAAKTDAAVVVLQPVAAVIKNGVLYRNGSAGCKLVANTGLNLQQLYYHVSFFDVRAFDGDSVILSPFDFAAPTSATTLDLATLTPAAGTPATGVPFLSNVTVPTTPASNGSIGQVAWNSTHFYVCTATNTWRRFSLSTW